MEVTSSPLNGMKGKMSDVDVTIQDINQNGFTETPPVVTNGYHNHHKEEDEIIVTSSESCQDSEVTSHLNITQILVAPKETQDIPLKSNGYHDASVESLHTNTIEQTSSTLIAEPDKDCELKTTTVKPDGKVKIQQEGGFLTNLEPVTVPGLLQRSVTQYPDNVALAHKGEDGTWKRVTYKQYQSLVRTCAKAFIKLGLKRYHSVGILGFNSPQWFIADMAAIHAGGFAAGIYTTNSADACFHCADTSRANIIVVQDQKQLEKILEIQDRLPELKAIVQYEGVPTEAGVLSWDEMMKLGSEQTDDELDAIMSAIQSNECCTLVYTSGTTGNPKAVMLSHDNLTWTARVASEYINVTYGEEVVVSYLPLSHVAAQIVDLFVSLNCAAAVYFGDKNALKGSLVHTLQEARPTQFLGVPRVWEKINEKMALAGGQASGVKKAIATWAKKVGYQHNIDRMNKVHGHSMQYMLANMIVFKKVKKMLGLDRCKHMLSGAAPLSTDTKKYFWSLDLTLCEGFGMSETSGCHTININSAFRLESIGRSVPGCLTKIKNPDSNKHGEIMLKGRNIFMGYLNEVQKTNESFDEEGWFHTGDVGYIDSEGFVYITGRIKELIITAGGENIAPVLIEHQIIEELPCISNAVLIGDHRKFLSVLLTLKSEVNIETGEPLEELSATAKNWCRSIGSFANTVGDIVVKKDEKVYAAIQAGIDRANAKSISNAQKVQKFAFLAQDFSLGCGELGPTMKVKRNVVTSKHAELINSFYE